MEKCYEGVFVGYGWSGSFFRSDSIRQDIDMVTARINYRFGGPGVVRY
jgi:outer membrane immunogenic protein